MTADAAVFRKIRARVLPILIVSYFIAFVDRVNLGFAALTMNADLGFGPTVYGWGAGIFFIGYFVFEVPSNLALERFGARAWLSRIMISWGAISMAMAAVHGTTSFFLVRFLLGVAEAGFYPGVVLYLTYWFPVEERARVVGWFTLASPLAVLVAGPISGALLSAPAWAGIKSWQWLFLLEGAPAVMVGLLLWWVLPDRPDEARWLKPDERERVALRIAADQETRAVSTPLTLWQALAHPRLLLLGAIYFGCVAGNYGLSFWLPQIVKAFGVTNFQTGLISALPYGFGAIAMVAWGAHSDRTRERHWHVVLPLALTSASLLVASQLAHPVWTMLFLSLAGVGIFASIPPFWTLPTSITTGSAAAGGIGLVNSIGNLSGFAAPYLIGAIKGTTGSLRVALAGLAMIPLLALILAVLARRSVERAVAPAT